MLSNNKEIRTILWADTAKESEEIKDVLQQYYPIAFLKFTKISEL
jgi:hypothetical protein